MTTDLVLAAGHHLLAFGLFGVFLILFVMVRPGLSGAALHRVAIIDRFQGVFAGLLVIVGVLRVLYGLKGPDFYTSSWTFWAKMAAFVAVGLLTVPPTLRIIAWHKAARADPAFVVPEAEARRLRGFFGAGLILFTTIPVLAAMMARGVGL